MVDSKEMLVEIKGVGKSATKGHLGQLLTDAEQRPQKFDKLALIVNAWKELPLEERGTNDKPWYPDNVIRMAEAAEVVLVSTQELLEALREHWASGHGLEIVRKMLATIGRFELKA